MGSPDGEPHRHQLQAKKVLEGAGDVKHSKGRDNTSNDETPTPPAVGYTLREHCQLLSLKTQTAATTTTTTSKSQTTVWYCDLTKPFCPRSYQLLDDVVQDYCQPLPHCLLEDEYVGITTISDDKIPVRTVSIQLRPDTKQSSIWNAVQDAFRAVHPKHSLTVQKPSSPSSTTTKTPATQTSQGLSSSFQAIGCDGHLPLWVVVDIATHKQSPWQRRLWIRIYHAIQCPNIMEEQLQKIGGVSNQKSLLGDIHTPWNKQLKEASALVQFVLENQLPPTCCCPQKSAKDTSIYFQNEYRHVPSVLSIQQQQQQQQQRNKKKYHLSTHFPSLSIDDYPLVQESVPLISRIWSELELANCTFNTLTRESKRFGMCGQPTLDKPFVQQLASISQQHMLLSIQTELEHAESGMHETLTSLHQVQEFIVDLMKTQYRVDVSDVVGGGQSSSSSSLGSNTTQGQQVLYGQTPVALPKRNPNEFPWHDAVRQALDSISHRVAEGCMKDFDPSVSIAMSHHGVYQVMQALGQADDIDQQLFLRQSNRQSMTRLLQQRAPLQRLIFDVLPQQCQVACSSGITAAQNLRHAVQRVHGLSGGQITNQVPLVECALPRGGCVIVTPQYFLVNTKPLSSMFNATQQKCQTIALSDVHIELTPQNLLSKVTILTTKGQVLAKLNPIHPVNWDQWMQLIQVLKGLQ